MTDAVEFANSARGQYILGQALYIAINVMKKEQRAEWSNIKDMEFLISELFPIYATMQDAYAEMMLNGPNEGNCDDEE
jgi:hypothetical protein